MAVRVLICFPEGDVPALRAEAAQLAFGLVARGDEVIALGQLGSWRHSLRMAHIRTIDMPSPVDAKKVSQHAEDIEPQIIHAFGIEMSHVALPLTLLVGAGGFATLGHEDLSRIHPAQLRTASGIFVPCEHLREQVSRRLPSVPVMAMGYMLPAKSETAPARLRFLAEELGVSDQARIILYADQFNSQETEVARALIQTAPIIDRHVPDAHILIVGSGIRLGELEQLAIDMNDRLGKRIVILPGTREDIPDLLALSSVAVGSGRFAMEAMAAGVPLVAAGAAGMIGVFTEENASLSLFSCCGRHGRLERVTSSALGADIVGLFAYPQLSAGFAATAQQLVQSQSARDTRAEQIASYYERSAPTGAIIRTPHRVTIILPDDPRELLFTLPAISGLRNSYPLTQLTLVTTAQHAPFLSRLPWETTVLIKPRNWREWPAFLRSMLRPKADACLSFASDLLSSFLCGCSLARHRLGFTESSVSLFLTDHLNAKTPPSPSRSLTLMHALGVSTPGAIPRPTLPEDLRETVSLSLLAAGVEYADQLILLCMPADQQLAWPDGNWVTLARTLAESHPERIGVVCTDEKMPLPEGVIAIMPATDILRLAALLTRASLVISSDSAYLHLAGIMGVPAIGLYGPTNPAQIAGNATRQIPLFNQELPCRPCETPNCAERQCIRALSVSEVLTAIEEMTAAPSAVAE